MHVQVTDESFVHHYLIEIKKAKIAPLFFCFVVLSFLISLLFFLKEGSCLLILTDVEFKRVSLRVSLKK